MNRFAPRPLDSFARLLRAVPAPVPRGLLILALALASWLPIGAAWMILKAAGGLN